MRVATLNHSVSLWRVVSLCVISFLGVNCAPVYVPDSLDLSMIRIGQNRARIESTLNIIRSVRSQNNNRVVVLYDYGPGVEGARRAAEASVLCLPTIGGIISCSMLRALHRGLADSYVEELQGSILQVVYNGEGYVQWVVFGSTVDELEKANRMIDAAEHGNADAALKVGNSFSEGANGFPVDSINAYKWLSISNILGAKGALDERELVGARLSSEERKKIDKQARKWTAESFPSSSLK